MYSSFISSYYIYIICFNVLIDLILMIRLRKTEGYGSQEQWIGRLLIVGMVCSVSDILCIALSPETSGLLFYLVNCLFYFAFVGSTLLIMNYSLNVLNLHMKNKMAETVLKMLPMLILSVGMISSYWAHSVFYVDASGVYQRGDFYLLFYITCCLYVFALTIISVVALIKGRTKGHGLINPLVFALSILIGTAMQVFIPAVPLSNMGLTVAFLLVFMSNQEKIINRNRDERDRILREHNEAQTAQIGKITALNAELEERQAQLEEATAEQEAQIEEITALNAELEERQAQLEEATAEQEAQIEEITALNGELQGQKEQMEGMNVLLEERLSIIRSALNGYFAAYYIDLESNQYSELKSIPSIRARYAADGAAQESLFSLCENLIQPEFKEQMRQFVDLSTISERMQGKNLVSMRYIGNTSGWSEAYFIVSDRTPEGTLKSIIWCSRSINDEIAREQEYEKNLITAKEAAEAANNAKSTFLFNMSHDIRTPMNAIMGFRDLLEKHQEEPEKRADYLKKIEESSNVLLSIINNVLEMARIEKGTIEIDESAWSAEQFNDTLYSIFQEMMTQKGIQFTRQIDVKNQYVFCDSIKLREVFINILANAYKYTNSGGSVNMHLEEIPSDREGYAMYQTTITDTGIGMSEEFLPHIFEEFSRENSTTDNKIEGTGLGMPIVKRLVDLMEGTIEVKSEKGVGSTFIVTIPHRITEKSSLVEHAGVEIDPKLFVGKRILLAEDNELNAEIATEILGEAGFIIDRAEDGVICCEKLAVAADNYYDLILMDIQMPNMNGYDATRTIRKMQDSAKANIPILAMTANAFEEDKREAQRAGMNGHLAKPINVTELMKALAGILG